MRHARWIWFAIAAMCAAGDARAQDADPAPAFPTADEIATWPSIQFNGLQLSGAVRRARDRTGGPTAVPILYPDETLDGWLAAHPKLARPWHPASPHTAPTEHTCVTAISWDGRRWRYASPDPCAWSYGRDPTRAPTSRVNPDDTRAFAGILTGSWAVGTAAALVVLTDSTRRSRIHGGSYFEPLIWVTPAGMAVGAVGGALVASPRRPGVVARTAVTAAASMALFGLGVAGTASNPSAGAYVEVIGSVGLGVVTPVVGAFGGP